eukprot:GILI01022758.1.p3 GENE.GILI01022758.1~~GILI01022758.1.p3  ORF type:complete len:126 (+),score=38.11 GILI01022758.1:1-378(+)
MAPPPQQFLMPPPISVSIGIPTSIWIQDAAPAPAPVPAASYGAAPPAFSAAPVPASASYYGGNPSSSQPASYYPSPSSALPPYGPPSTNQPHDYNSAPPPFTPQPARSIPFNGSMPVPSPARRGF